MDPANLQPQPCLTTHPAQLIVTPDPMTLLLPLGSLHFQNCGHSVYNKGRFCGHCAQSLQEACACNHGFQSVLAFPPNPIGHLLVVAVSVSCESAALVSVGRRVVKSGESEAAVDIRAAGGGAIQV